MFISRTNRRKWLVLVPLLALLISYTQHVALAATGPSIIINASTGQHPISQYIYGINPDGDNPANDTALSQLIGIPVKRWGGNNTSRYNYMMDADNRGRDWYFENIPYDNTNVAALPNGSAADKFVAKNNTDGAKSLVTIPMIGWVAKSRVYAQCSYNTTKYPNQQDADWQWHPECGNGKHASDGSWITADPTDANVAVDSTFMGNWVKHLTSVYGTAANGGVLFYDLDNEPDIWHDTHHDVHPNGLTYDELRDRTYQYGAAVKAADPSAQTLGPVGWGYLSFIYSGKDQQEGNWGSPVDTANHGGVPFADWYLQQMAAYQQAHGVRILDYFDMHIYPQQNNVSLSDAVDATTAALRLRSTRQLWDPTYVDESWIGDSSGAAVNMIPRMKSLIAANYPGTKTAITEYNWGAYKDINGALAEADVLGIFGREGLDLATLWVEPQTTDPVTYAFRMYRNYNGAGAKFGDTSITASSSNQEQLSVYAAKRSSDGALTLMFVNKDPSNAFTSSIALSGFTAGGAAKVYRYSAANLGAIVTQPDQTVSSSFSATFPAYSVTLMVIPASTGGSTATNTATSTATKSATATTATFAPPTNTSTGTQLPTSTSTLTKTAIPTSTVTSTNTATKTSLPTLTATYTATKTATSTATATKTLTPTSTLPPTKTLTPTKTATSTATPSSTKTPTNTPTATFTATSTIVPTGSGLRGDYFNNPNFTLMVFSRIDPQVNFDWGAGSPDGVIAPDTFSIRWNGQVQPAYSQTYTFYVNSDDGVHLWVNGTLIINSWTVANAERAGAITLVGGQKYDIVLEYFENTGNAKAILSWSSPSQPKQVIPTERLYPPAQH